MIVAGETVTTGMIAMVAVAFADVLAALVAVTVIVMDVFTAEGAVYKPEVEIVPTCGLIDHVTAEFDEPVTVADS